MSRAAKHNGDAPFTPKPGSVPDRAHAYLLGQPPGTFITSPELAKILGVPAKAMMGSLASLVTHGLVKRERRREGHGYLLGDSFDADEANGGKPTHRIVPASQTPPPSSGVASVFDLAKAPAVQAAAPLPPEPEPAQTTPATRGLDWRPGKPLPSRTPTEEHLPAPAAAAVAAAPPSPATASTFRCALWSTGELVLCIGDEEIVLDRAKTTTLIHYLDRMAVEPTPETTV